MIPFDKLNPKQKELYSRLCYEYLAELAERETDKFWDIDNREVESDVLIKVDVKYRSTCSGQRHFDPQKHTFNRKVTAVFNFENLHIDFESNFEIKY